MRGAGMDATQLFDDYHRWVNYDAMLEKFRIGYLIPDGADSGQGEPSALTDSTGNVQPEQYSRRAFPTSGIL